MQNNIIYLYPTQDDTPDISENRSKAIMKVAHIAARIIDLFAAVGIFLCIGVCTLLFFSML